MATISEAGWGLGQRRWQARYEQLAEQLKVSAPGARPVLLSSTVDVDDIYVMTPARLRSLRREGLRQGGLAAELALAVGSLVSEGRDGELFWDWAKGLGWLADVIGPPDRVQVGGTGPQAAWALDVLGAQSIMALGGRSRELLDVLAAGVLVCTSDGRTVPVHEMAADGDAVAIRNEILEFPGGSGVFGSSADRSNRVILRFLPTALERDEHFMAMQEELGPRAGAAVLAGLNGLAVSDGASREWASRLLRVWRECGPGLRHVELGDTARPAELRTVMAGLRGLSSSLGMSLSELSLWGPSSGVAAKALELAHRLKSPSVVVHADRWSLAVHRSDPEVVTRRLMTGNLLASVRAAAGVPGADLAPVGSAVYDEDVPESGPLDGGWRVDCAPVPFVARPASTIGLGDTFTAGLLLAAALEGA